MILYFIRHGRPEYPIDQHGQLLVYGPAAGLSHEGAERITRSAYAIRHREGRPFDRLITSPYRRARETAWLVAKVMEIDPGSILEDVRLCDTDSTWPGKPMELFLRAWDQRTVFDDSHTLETLAQLRTRMTAAVEEYADRFYGKTIGFIGHGDPFRAWLFPNDRPLSTYDALVRSTFESAEGIRVVMHEDKKIETEIIGNFERWNPGAEKQSRYEHEAETNQI